MVQPSCCTQKWSLPNVSSHQEWLFWSCDASCCYLQKKKKKKFWVCMYLKSNPDCDTFSRVLENMHFIPLTTLDKILLGFLNSCVGYHVHFLTRQCQMSATVTYQFVCKGFGFALWWWLLALQFVPAMPQGCHHLDQFLNQSHIIEYTHNHNHSITFSNHFSLSIIRVNQWFTFALLCNPRNFNDKIIVDWSTMINKPSHPQPIAAHQTPIAAVCRHLHQAHLW